MCQQTDPSPATHAQTVGDWLHGRRLHTPAGRSASSRVARPGACTWTLSSPVSAPRDSTLRGAQGSKSGRAVRSAHRTRRVRLVREEGRDVSSQYGREGGGPVLPVQSPSGFDSTGMTVTPAPDDRERHRQLAAGPSLAQPRPVGTCDCGRPSRTRARKRALPPRAPTCTRGAKGTRGVLGAESDLPSPTQRTGPGTPSRPWSGTRSTGGPVPRPRLSIAKALSARAAAEAAAPAPAQLGARWAGGSRALSALAAPLSSRALIGAMPEPVASATTCDRAAGRPLRSDACRKGLAVD